VEKTTIKKAGSAEQGGRGEAMEPCPWPSHSSHREGFPQGTVSFGVFQVFWAFAHFGGQGAAVASR